MTFRFPASCLPPTFPTGTDQLLTNHFHRSKTWAQTLWKPLGKGFFLVNSFLVLELPKDAESFQKTVISSHILELALAFENSPLWTLPRWSPGPFELPGFWVAPGPIPERVTDAREAQSCSKATQGKEAGLGPATGPPDPRTRAAISNTGSKMYQKRLAKMYLQAASQSQSILRRRTSYPT